MKKSNDKKAPVKQALTWRWLAAQVLGLIRQFGNSLIWATVCIFLIREIADTFKAFAGRTSIANLALDVAAKLNATVVVSITLTGVTGLLYIFEYRRHRRTRKRLTSRITELELRLDPNRTSSELTREGTTRTGDL